MTLMSSAAVHITFHHKTILINSKLIILKISFFRGFGKQVSGRTMEQVKYMNLQQPMKHPTFYRYEFNYSNI